MPQPTVVENFAADTGQFTVSGGGPYGSGSFAITGGQGVYTNSAGGLIHVTAAADTANMPVVVDALSVYIEIGTSGYPVPTGSYVNICPGIFKGAADQLQFEFGNRSNLGPNTWAYDFLVFISSGQHNLVSGSFVDTRVPEAVGMSLVGNIATGFVRYSGLWTQVVTVDVNAATMGAVDYTAGGALTGFFCGCSLVTSASDGATVSIGKLWSGPPIVVGQIVPDVSGLPLGTAYTDITSLGLVIGNVTQSCSNTVPVGYVISTNPASGSNVPDGSTVDIVVSNGLCSPTFFVYGKFAPAAAYPPTLLINAKGIEPVVYMPKENITVQT